ncbi:MFS transporter [Chloroflexota bacterium]
MAKVAEGDNRKKIFGLHPNIFFMGLTSLLTDVSSDMIFTLVPLFLTNVLGAAGTVVGIVGGLSEGIDSVVRIFSGWLSDKLGKRKFLAVLGYSISTVSKPFLLLANVWGVVLAVRFTERIGKGVRTSARDALVADSVSSDERGKGFGVHRAMDTTGAFLGLVIAAVVVYFVQGTGAIELTMGCFRYLVIGGVVPAVLAVIVLQSFVRERKRTPSEVISTSNKMNLSGIRGSFDSRFWIFLAVTVVFTLGNSSDFFVILRAQDLGAPLLHVVLMLVVWNAAEAALSLPMGILSDKLGRRRVLIMGWFIYALVYMGFAVSTSLWQIWILFAGYGIYYGIAQGVARAFVADLAPADKRGTAYGLYHGVVGLSLVASSVIAGLLWDNVSSAAPFYLGAGLALVAMVGIITLVKE